MSPAYTEVRLPTPTTLTPHPTSDPQPSQSHLSCLLPQLWLLHLWLWLWLWLWLLVFLHTFSLDLLWQLLTPLVLMPLSKIIQSLSPDLAAILGKDELGLGDKAWVRRGQGRFC